MTRGWGIPLQQTANRRVGKQERPPFIRNIRLIMWVVNATELFIEGNDCRLANGIYSDLFAKDIDYRDSDFFYKTKG